jgi:hypothetical protein
MCVSGKPDYHTSSARAMLSTGLDHTLGTVLVACDSVRRHRIRYQAYATSMCYSRGGSTTCKHAGSAMGCCPHLNTCCVASPPDSCTARAILSIGCYRTLGAVLCAFTGTTLFGGFGRVGCGRGEGWVRYCERRGAGAISAVRDSSQGRCTTRCKHTGPPWVTVNTLDTCCVPSPPDS